MKKRWLLLTVLWIPLQARTTAWVTEPTNAISWKAIEDDNGGFYLLWTHPEVNSIQVLGQHFGSDGSAAWPNPGQMFLPVVTDTSSWTLFADAAKGVGLVWVEGGRVSVQRWTPAGQPAWKLPVRVSDARFMAASPAGIADGSGGVYAVWSEKIAGGRAVLMAQHLNAQGVPLWPVGMRVSLRPSNQRQPTVAFDGAAGLIISWADYLDFASDWRVQRIDFQGFRLWGLQGVEITAPAGSDSSRLRIAPWGQGSLTVAWVNGEHGRSQVRNRQINPKGTPLSEEKGAAVFTGDQWNPVLTGDGKGHYWVGWEDNRNNENWKIYVRRGGPDMPLTPDSTGDQGQLALAEDNAEGAYAAWIENRRGGVALYAQHLNAQGQGLWEKDGREVATPLKHPDVPSILLLAPDRAVVVWADQPSKGHYALYWQLLK